MDLINEEIKQNNKQKTLWMWEGDLGGSRDNRNGRQLREGAIIIQMHITHVWSGQRTNLIKVESKQNFALSKTALPKLKEFNSHWSTLI